MARFDQAMTVQRQMIDHPDGEVHLEVLVAGSGPDVVLLPSARRGAEDFAVLQRALADAGYRSLAVNPRGAGRSIGPTDGITLRELGNDVAMVIDEFGNGPAHVVGHALGNIVARATGTYRPDVVRSLTLMPPGGHDLARHPVPRIVHAHLRRCDDRSLSDEERLESLRIAFFAPGNDPSSWLEGWWPTKHVGDAFLASDPAEWWRGGRAPMLIIQPLEDVMGTISAGREFAAAIGDRAQYVELERCGHALLPEQPELVADLVVRFLRRIDG